jgi:hypothetical protein
VYRLTFITYWLSDGNYPDVVLGELAQVEFLLEGLAEKSAIAVDNDKIERMLSIACSFDHLLEGRPAIIASRCTGFDVLRNELMAIGAAP